MLVMSENFGPRFEATAERTQKHNKFVFSLLPIFRIDAKHTQKKIDIELVNIYTNLR